MAHIEELAQTDSEAEKRVELRGFHNKWKNASLCIDMAIYLDVLSPLHRLSLSMQSGDHNPVKQVRRLTEFTWTMAKLKMYVDQVLEGMGEKFQQILFGS